MRYCSTIRWADWKYHSNTTRFCAMPSEAKWPHRLIFLHGFRQTIEKKSGAWSGCSGILAAIKMPLRVNTYPRRHQRQVMYPSGELTVTLHRYLPPYLTTTPRISWMKHDNSIRGARRAYHSYSQLTQRSLGPKPETTMGHVLKSESSETPHKRNLNNCRGRTIS